MKFYVDVTIAGFAFACVCCALVCSNKLRGVEAWSRSRPANIWQVVREGTLAPDRRPVTQPLRPRKCTRLHLVDGIGGDAGYWELA